MLALHAESLMGQLAHLPDPRRRSGRRYPLGALLGMEIIGMLNGQDSLHSTWIWTAKRPPSPDCPATPQAPAPGYPPGAPTTTSAGCPDD